MLLEDGVCYDQFFLQATDCQTLPCFILYSKAKLAVTPGISWLPTFAFQRNAKRNAKKSRKLRSLFRISKVIGGLILPGIHRHTILLKYHHQNIGNIVDTGATNHAAQSQKQEAFLLETHANHYHVSYILPYSVSKVFLTETSLN